MLKTGTSTLSRFATKHDVVGCALATSSCLMGTMFQPAKQSSRCFPMVTRGNSSAASSMTEENNASKAGATNFELVKIPSLPLVGSMLPWHSGIPPQDLTKLRDNTLAIKAKFGHFYKLGIPGLGVGSHGAVNSQQSRSFSSCVPNLRQTLPCSRVPNMQQRRSFASKASALSLASKKRKGHKITMVTAYDYPSAVHVARAEIDVILVGDSVAMVELGYDTTQPVTVEQMIHHCQSVKRGVEQSGVDSGPMLVGDLPFGSYEFEDTDVALRNAYKFVKEAGMDAVKLEGGSEARARTAKRIVDGGVAVMGHVGLTPQAISVIGGFRAQGRTASRARSLLDDALRLQDAGVFSVVLECVPANVAAAITETLEIPTIGIGAGGGTSGQVLVYHDMLGMLSHPHHEQFMPKFCKQYAEVGHSIQDGLQDFKADVESGAFPSDKYSPYVMSEKERAAFDNLLQIDEDERKRKHDEAAAKMAAADEYEQLSLYGKDNTTKK